MTTNPTFLTRIDMALRDGRETVERVQRFLAANRQSEARTPGPGSRRAADAAPERLVGPAGLRTHSSGSQVPTEIAGDSTSTSQQSPALAEDVLPGVLREASERLELSIGYRYLFENQPGLVSRVAAAME